MTRRILQRLHDGDTQTLGHLFDEDGGVIACTLELPGRDNAPNVSRIPAGIYVASRRWSQHFGRIVFEVRDVPGRADILIHPANRVQELRGCIALGMRFEDIDGDGVLDVASSRDAFSRFMQVTPMFTFELEIRDATT